jgi:hypothetical protein
LAENGQSYTCNPIESRPPSESFFQSASEQTGLSCSIRASRPQRAKGLEQYSHQSTNPQSNPTPLGNDVCTGSLSALCSRESFAYKSHQFGRSPLENATTTGSEIGRQYKSRKPLAVSYDVCGTFSAYSASVPNKIQRFKLCFFNDGWFQKHAEYELSSSRFLQRLN